MGHIRRNNIAERGDCIFEIAGELSEKEGKERKRKERKEKERKREKKPHRPHFALKAFPFKAFPLIGANSRKEGGGREVMVKERCTLTLLCVAAPCLLIV
jgi:hypothetical protein